MNDRILLALILSALIVGVGVAGATGASADDRMTICHKPDGEARTMQVPRSAWSGHRGHGDHEGACGTRDRAAPSGPPGDGGEPEPVPPAPPAPPAHVTASAVARGDVDGEARFDVTLRNDGEGDAGEVRLTGRLRGDGDWSVRSGDADCAVQGRALSCTLDALPAGGTATVRLLFDGGPGVCHEPNVRLEVVAEGDDGADDDGSGASARAGACAALDDDPRAS